MIDIRFARENPDAVRESQRRRGNDEASVDALLAAVDALAKNAPAGSEGAVKLLRQSVVEANTAFEKVQAASRQVLDLIDANVNNLAKKGEAAAKKK